MGSMELRTMIVARSWGLLCKTSIGSIVINYIDINDKNNEASRAWVAAI